MNTLQSLTLPNLDVRADEELYVRLNDRCWTDLARRAVGFAEGGVMSADTFYNGLSVGAWKRRCEVGELLLRLRGNGEFVATLGLHRAAQGSVWLDQRRLTLTPDGTDCRIDAWPELGDGMLFLRLRALGAGELMGGGFVTTSAPLREVRLGLVLTHYNRVAQVEPAVRRIRRDLLDRTDIGGHITLTVVDNSRNLMLEPHPALTHLMNRNLGGTGGFVRGLLALIDGGAHTHALFMDDDASCEPDSLARCLALLQFAKDPRLAVAGALLREVAPWELLEKAARFDGKVQPLKAGLDMRRVGDLLEADRSDARPDYGAWWLFAFPLSEVRAWPFPFFVRGDDIHFGLQNRFDIATINGVACLGEDFSSKQGPLTAYLDARYHLVHALLAPNGSASRIFWVGSRLFLKALTSYLYTSARAVTLAMQHTLLGPQFFVDNIDMQAVRTQISSWTPSEKMLPIDRTAYALKGTRRKEEKKLRRLLRIVTLQGFVLPGWLLRDRMTVQPKHFHGRASAVFRYRKVLYEHAQSGTGFIAEFDRRRFFHELGGFLKAWMALFRQLPALRRDYAAGVQEIATQAFWRGVYPETRVPAEANQPDAETVEAQGELS